MSKDYLEALEEIRDFRYGKDKLLVCHTEMYKTIKQALQRLEAIDNAKPSEALEMLKGVEYVADVLKVNHKIGSRDIANQEIKEMVDRLNYRIPTIKQALIKAQEQENIFSIIKKYLFNEDDEPTKEETDLLNTYFGYNQEVNEDEGI